MKLFHLLPLLSLTLLACGSNNDESTDATGDEADITQKGGALLSFPADPSKAPTLKGTLAAGGKLQIHYPEGRLAKCRGNLNDGSPGWTITGFWQLDKAAPSTFFVAGHASDPSQKAGDAVLSIPAGGTLSLWFQNTDTFGCSAYDSNLSANYTFQVAGSKAPAATITFGADPSKAPTVSGSLKAGSQVQIKYAADRLTACRGGLSNGAPAWTITGFYTLNDKQPAKSFYAGGHASDPSQAAQDGATLSLPEAGELEVWFENTSSYGCDAYDSNNSKNYRFAIGG